MALYAIADLHLGNYVEKPMGIFGENWVDHDKKIKKNWLETVKEDDTVLIPGDISWAINMKEALSDLKWIEELPGEKILLKGNHDYWWSSISKLNSSFHRMKFLQNNYYTYEDYAICGTRGWITPNKNKFTLQDEKIYHREAHRLGLSLETAQRDGYKKIICMLHYPPTNELYEESLFTQMFKEYNVETVVYGHLHGEDYFNYSLQGEHDGINYYLVSCDYLDFKLHKIL